MKSVLEEGEDGKPCIVNFAPTEDGINVTDNDGCRGYCGARAHFVSLYLKPKPMCKPAALRTTHNEFKKLYEQKAYLLAKAKLEPVLNDCFNVLDRWELGWIRNDLAITMYKLGDYKGCREVLRPVEEEAKEADEDIRSKYGPMVEESALRLVKAARTNVELCK